MGSQLPELSSALVWSGGFPLVVYGLLLSGSVRLKSSQKTFATPITSGYATP